MGYVCDVLYAVLYVRFSCFVVRGCAVSRRYIHVCNCDMLSVVYVYLDHLKFCVMCIDCRSYVCCSECNVVSKECNVLCCEVMYFGCFGIRGQFGFLYCDDVCMCVVNKQFELLEFVFDSVYVDLQYNKISLTFTAGSVSLCCVCGRLWSVCEFVMIPHVDEKVCDCVACTIVCVACVSAEGV